VKFIVIPSGARDLLLFLALCSSCSAQFAGAQEQEETRGAPLERDDAAEIREQIAIAQDLLGKTADRGAVLYFLAASHALLQETLPALEQLKECLALKEGFDPSGDNAFAALKTSPDFQKLVEQVHKDFPAVNLSKVAITTTDKDIFPEGLAYDSHDDSFYLSSIHLRKIIKIPHEGKIVDFVPSDRYSLLPVQGIRLDPTDGTIWTNSSNDAIGTSELLHFDRSGTLLARYLPPEKGKHDFNDLVVLRGGDIYLTDTLANKVYRFDSRTHSFTTLPISRGLLAPNGIALTDDEHTLFVADQLGVLSFDLKSGASIEVDPTPHNTLAGIDGLYWHKGSLITVQNGIGTPRVVAFHLTPDGLRVTKTTVLQNFLKTPTTGAIRGDDFYFIVNTQIDNLNGEHILDNTKLQPVRIAVVHLP
jgi:sugar lactone lactonase YvrE